MDFTIPHNNAPELALYIWKIINIPLISENDLLFELSFKLNILSPEKAKFFLNECIKKKILEKNKENLIKLSPSIAKNLQDWQQKRRKSICRKINQKNKTKFEVEKIENSNNSDFGALIKSFSEKVVLNRAVAISDESFKFTEYNIEEGRITARVKGTKTESYKIEFNLEKRYLRHNCYDYTERKSKEKRFCKHLTKFFLLLNSRDEMASISFLEKIVEEIEDWDFSS
ncbi:MAG: DUF2240 family protein [Promethearchaeota archaeon]